MERHILKEGTSSCPISSSWGQGVPKLAPPYKPYRQRRDNASDRLCIPGSTLDSDGILKLSAWFSYQVVPFRLHTCSTSLLRRPAIPCLLIPTWQLVKANRVIRNEPKIHVYSHYITYFLLFRVIWICCCFNTNDHGFLKKISGIRWGWPSKLTRVSQNEFKYKIVSELHQVCFRFFLSFFPFPEAVF